MKTTDDTIQVEGHDIDLHKLYHEMWQQSAIDQGKRVYNGHKTEAMKRLLARLFGIPVKYGKDPVNAAARRAVTLELDRRGWATKVDKHNQPALEGTRARTSRYVLHHDPDDLP